ncbi:MAG: type I methionyl aminopeptidase [Candidatus Paceibacterota bacterium]|jgi:methionyl aminopeptidase
MSYIKSSQEIEILREGGRRLALVLKEVAAATKAGVMPKELDALAEKLIRAGGDEPAFLNYQPDMARIPFPATLCVSVNDAVVHGIPGETPLVNGDIVGLDLGLKHRGLFTDAAVTVAIGKISKEAKELMKITREALELGINEARAGNYTGDIGYVIERHVAPHHYGIVRELSGHGVGHEIHEEPYIPNYGKRGEGMKLKAGMVIAIEPMINLGSGDIRLAKDKFTYATKDGSLSAHFEHTLVITDGAPEVLTR